jgi:hypothetical protein
MTIIKIEGLYYSIIFRKYEVNYFQSLVTLRMTCPIYPLGSIASGLLLPCESPCLHGIMLTESINQQVHIL